MIVARFSLFKNNTKNQLLRSIGPIATFFRFLFDRRLILLVKNDESFLNGPKGKFPRDDQKSIERVSFHEVVSHRERKWSRGVLKTALPVVGHAPLSVKLRVITRKLSIIIHGLGKFDFIFREEEKLALSMHRRLSNFLVADCIRFRYNASYRKNGWKSYRERFFSPIEWHRL